MEKKVSNNIFDYATKELSQDAFICWLVSWINRKEENRDLYYAANTFLEYICKEIGLKEFEIDEINRQEKKCDVLIKLKNGYYIIIEDKIYSKEHNAGNTLNNQIEEYKDAIAKARKINDKNKIITVYYKMIDDIKENKSADINIDRKFMLENVLKRDIDNDIYMDYKRHLNNINSNIENIKKIPLNKWTNNPELLYYFGKKNKRIFEGIEAQRVSGSIFFDWYIKNFDPKGKITKKMGFKKIYLCVDLNYGKANIGIRAKTISEFSNEEQERIVENLENYLDKFKKGLVKYNKKNKNKKDYDTMGLIKICINKNLGKETDALLYKDLFESMKDIQDCLTKFIKDNS